MRFFLIKKMLSNTFLASINKISQKVLFEANPEQARTQSLFTCLGGERIGYEDGSGARGVMGRHPARRNPYSYPIF